MTPEFPVHGRLAFAESFVEPILAGEKTVTVRLPGECDAGALESAATEAGVVEFETPAGTAFARADVRSVWRVDAATLSRAQLGGHEADLDSVAAVRELLGQFYPERAHELPETPSVLVATWDVVEAVGDRESAGEPAETGDVVRILTEAGVDVRKVNYEKPNENGVKCKLEVAVPIHVPAVPPQLEAVKDAAIEAPEFGMGGKRINGGEE